MNPERVCALATHAGRPRTFQRTSRFLHSAVRRHGIRAHVPLAESFICLPLPLETTCYHDCTRASSAPPPAPIGRRLCMGAFDSNKNCVLICGASALRLYRSDISLQFVRHVIQECSRGVARENAAQADARLVSALDRRHACIPSASECTAMARLFDLPLPLDLMVTSPELRRHSAAIRCHLDTDETHLAAYIEVEKGV